MLDYTKITENLQEMIENGLSDQLAESRRDIEMRLLQLEEIGWKRLYGEMDSEEGFSLESLKSVTKDLYDMTATSPMVKRGIQLRHGYTYGKGFDVNIPDSSKVTRNVLEDTYNREAILGVDATERLITEDMACGNAFHIKVGSGASTQIIAVPLSQIAGVITDENDAQRVQYFLREWTVREEVKREWIPLHRYKSSLPKGVSIPKTIRTSDSEPPAPVAQDIVGFMYTGLRPAGWTFGIPTALAAKAYIVMYTESMQNNALLVKMLSQFAWKIMSKTSSGSSNAGAVVASAKGVGGTASMREGQDIQAVPRGNDVNFNNVQPLAAMVAATFGVSVIALLSSPGATGGSYGAATTLDEPTLNVMSTLQSKMAAYMEEIINSIAPAATEKVTLSFPSMSTDADYRKVQSIVTAHDKGLLHQSEARDMTLEILPVPNPKKTLPKGNGFNSYSDPKAEITSSPTGVASQGNSGGVAGGFNQGETDHSLDKDRE